MQTTRSRILLDRTDGDLTDEQEKQVVFIRDGIVVPLPEDRVPSL